MVTTDSPAPDDQLVPAGRWLGVLRPGEGEPEVTFGPFEQAWHAASVMAGEVRRRQDAADVEEIAAIEAAEDAYAALLDDRAAIDRGEVAFPAAPPRRDEDQQGGEGRTWQALVNLADLLADPAAHARSGPWEVYGVAIGAMSSDPRAWRWSIRRVIDPLAEIASVRWQLREVAERLPPLVAAARAGGATWSQVGAAHGISRQAAQQRYDQSEVSEG